MQKKKWMVRGVGLATVQRINELRDEFETTTGALIDQAVAMLHSHLHTVELARSTSRLASEYSGNSPDRKDHTERHWGS